MDTMEIAGQSLSLSRWPQRKQDTLRAWDAADEYVLDEVLKHDKPGRVLLVNDGFGALACALASLEPVVWSDSVIARQATEVNLLANELPVLKPERFVPMHLTPPPFDCLLIKIPRSLALLEYQLQQLRPLMQADTKIIAAAMLKYLPKAAIELFEKIIGPTTTSLAKKKARLVYATLAEHGPGAAEALAKQAADTALPVSHHFKILDDALSIGSHPGVFSYGKLDVGSRFLLEHFPTLPQASSAIDMACGNGVLGIALQHLQPDVRLRFCD